MIKRHEGLTKGALPARVLCAYVMLGYGLSLSLQTGVSLSTRAFLEGFKVPFVVYGVLFLAFGVVMLVATWVSNAGWLSHTYQAASVLWMLWAFAFLVPAVQHPNEIPFTGFLGFSFIAGVFQVVALLEAQRQANVGMFRFEESERNRG